jgi:hypothetical protein
MQYLQGPLIAGLNPQCFLQPFNRFQIVVQNFGLRLQDDIQIFPITFQVRDQGLDGAAGYYNLDLLNTFGHNFRATVWQIVTGNHGQNGMTEIHFFYGGCYPLRFLRINEAGTSDLYTAKSATAGADIAEQHECGGTTGPAFPQIRTTGTFTYRMQSLLLKSLADLYKSISRTETNL